MVPDRDGLVAEARIYLVGERVAALVTVDIVENLDDDAARVCDGGVVGRDCDLRVVPEGMIAG